MEKQNKTKYGHGAFIPCDKKGGIKMLEHLLFDLMCNAETDPNVKDYKLSLQDGNPKFEVNVNGNVEEVTFYMLSNPDEMMKLFGFNGKE